MKKILQSLAVFAATALFSVTVLADEMRTYAVTITNATGQHVLTPVLLTTHKPRFHLFQVTGVASNGLVVHAETGDPSELAAEVSAAEGITDLVTGAGPILYGQTETYTIRAYRKNRLSFTSMLATTNDSFAGLDSVALPKKSATYYALAYDAGSEANNEDCAYIPGPPCAPGSGNARTSSGEGFITIANGVQGGADLNPKKLDWRGPVAIITITRIRH